MYYQFKFKVVKSYLTDSKFLKIINTNIAIGLYIKKPEPLKLRPFLSKKVASTKFLLTNNSALVKQKTLHTIGHFK